MKITTTLLTQIVTLGLFLFNCQNLKAPFFRICNSEAVRPAFAMRDETKTIVKTKQ